MPSAPIVSMSAASRRLPLGMTISPWATLTRTGSTAAAAASRAPSVRAWSNDEFGTMSGEISSAASVRSTASRPPAILPASCVRVCATSVSRNSRSNVRWSTWPAWVRTSAQRAGSSATRVACASSDRSGIATSSNEARSSGVRSAPKAVSTRSTRVSKAVACSAAIAIAASVVYVYWGGTASRASVRACSVRTSLSNVVARGAVMSVRAISPGVYWKVSSGRMSAPRIAVMTITRMPAATPRRVASLRVNRAITGARWINIGRRSRGSMGAPVMRGKVRLGEPAGHEATDDLAVGAAADAR